MSHNAVYVEQDLVNFQSLAILHQIVQSLRVNDPERFVKRYSDYLRNLEVAKSLSKEEHQEKVNTASEKFLRAV